MGTYEEAAKDPCVALMIVALRGDVSKAKALEIAASHSGIAYKAAILSHAIRAEFPQLRRGQSLWIALCMVSRDLSDELHYTQLDCFYRDDRIEPLMTFIETFIEGKAGSADS